MPAINLVFKACPEWPRLAWIAVLEPGKDAVTVLHGPDVETRPDWFAEAAWDGPFEEGGFDLTDNLTGSGARVRPEGLIFVPSGASIDRICLVRRAGCIFVSNSLIALAVHLDLEADPLHNTYHHVLHSVLRGYRKHERFLPLRPDPVEYVYVDNLRWDGHDLVRQDKPGGDRRFHCFADYEGFLRAAIAGIAANGADSARKLPFQLLGTLSNGYDSPCCVVLSRDAGLREALTFRESQFGVEDSGDAMAEQLGIRLTSMRRNDWRSLPMPEPLFLAADGFGFDIHFFAFRDQLAGRILMTGHNGDRAWDYGVEADDSMQRGHISGLSLAEVRLFLGMQHLCVPFLGLRAGADIAAIARSEEMRPWSIGGDYDRPIPRRVIESAGFARGSFATSKSATAVLIPNPTDGFLSAASRADFEAWMRSHTMRFLGAKRIPPQWRTALESPFVDRIGRLAELPGRQARDAGNYVHWHFPYTFPWAFQRSKELFREPARVTG